MRIFTGTLAILAMAILAGSAVAVDVDAKKLVGKWESKDDKKGITRTVEFMKDGKMTATAAADGKSSTFEGTYKVEGDKITMTAKGKDGDVKQVVTITKQSDDEVEGTSDGKVTRIYKRVKEKDKK